MRRRNNRRKPAGNRNSRDVPKRNNGGRLPATLIIAVDLLIGAVSYFLAWYIRIAFELPLTVSLLPQENWAAVDHFWVLLAVSQVFCLYIFSLYDDIPSLGLREIISYTFLSCAVQVFAVTSIFYFTNGVFPRSVLILFGGLNYVFLGTWRLVLARRGLGRTRRVLLVAENQETAEEVVGRLLENPLEDVSIEGILISGFSGEATSIRDIKVLGGVNRIELFIENYQIDELMFASTKSWKERLFESLSQVQVEKDLLITVLPSAYEIAIGRLKHVNIHDIPLLELRNSPNEPFQRMIKRSFDICFSLLVLLASLPLVLVISFVLKLFSPGPVFYSQERIGRGNRVFRLYKFRTMVPDAERDSGPVMSQLNDPRVTGVGRILRRFRLDEIPQFFNVIKGNMSLVGPRPERPVFVRKFGEETPEYNERHKVKPGITGLAQIRAHYETGAETKLMYDLSYIFNYSFSLDLVIILETIRVVLTRRGS